jgi:hypothetical protein
VVDPCKRSCEEDDLLGCNTVHLRESLMIWSNISPPSSGSKQYAKHENSRSRQQAKDAGMLFNKGELTRTKGHNLEFHNYKLYKNKLDTKKDIGIKI